MGLLYIGRDEGREDRGDLGRGDGRNESEVGFELGIVFIWLGLSGHKWGYGPFSLVGSGRGHWLILGLSSDPSVTCCLH